MRLLHDPFSESDDVVKGASISLSVTINRVLWRQARGKWPDDEISPMRRKLEGLIDRLVESEVERRRRGHIFEHERAGRRVVIDDRGRMKPL